MVEVGHRNGNHVIRALQDIPCATQLLKSCKLESDAEKDVVIPNINLILAPLNSTIQKELGWKVGKDNTIFVDELSDQLQQQAKLLDRGETIPNLGCPLYTSPSPRDKRQSRMPSSA